MWIKYTHLDMKVGDSCCIEQDGVIQTILNSTEFYLEIPATPSLSINGSTQVLNTNLTSHSLWTRLYLTPLLTIELQSLVLIEGYDVVDSFAQL